MGSAELRKQVTAAPSEAGPPQEFYTYFASSARSSAWLILLLDHGGRTVRGAAAPDSSVMPLAS
jgi:hypothetical protein